MFSHPELESDQSIGSDRESGCNNDGDKIEKASSFAEIPIRIDLVVPLTIHANQGGEL